MFIADNVDSAVSNDLFTVHWNVLYFPITHHSQHRPAVSVLLKLTKNAPPQLHSEIEFYAEDFNSMLFEHYFSHLKILENSVFSSLTMSLVISSKRNEIERLQVV